MRGVGEAYGAVTIVNAIPTGIGAAAAIDLSVRAEVEVAAPGGDPQLDVERGERTPLVEASYEAAIRAFSTSTPGSARLRLASTIPVARGLKSSSAVSVAILRAVASALDRPVTDEEVARLSADLSQRIGLSATGAFDDAVACAHGGVAVTDNALRRVLRFTELAPELEALLWIPPGTHQPSAAWRVEFESRRSEGQAVVDALTAGDLFEAMERNSVLVESVLGLNYDAIRRRLHDAGAVAAGVSGLGPTLAALVPPSRAIEAQGVVKGFAGEVRRVALRRGPLERGGLP